MTAVAMDPRLRERRLEVERAAGNRRIRRVLIVVAIVALIFGALVVSRSSLLDVDRIELYGLDTVTLDAADEAIDFQLGSPLLTLDLGGTERSLEAIPWVETAEVQRSWGGTITVEITERTPVALALAAEEQWVLVDRTGRVLSEPLLSPPLLPRVSGIRAAGPPGTWMDADSAAPLAVVQALPPSLASQVYGVWRDDRGEIRVGLADGPVAVFGDDDRLRAKVAALATMIDQLALEGRSAREIDLAVPNLPVVRGG